MAIKIFLVAALLTTLATMFYSWRVGITGKAVEEGVFVNETLNEVQKNFKSYGDLKVNFKDGELKAYRHMDLKVIPGRVILSDACASFSVATTLDKTDSLIRSVEGTYGVRPDEHDVLEEIMDVFEISLDYVAIEDIKGDIFYAHAVMHDDKNVLNLDLRPSDGIAMAARFDAPIYVAEGLLKQYAEFKC